MEIWEIGSYEVVGDWFASASRSVLDGGSMPTDFSAVDVIDVACGTGAVAIEAARRGATVLGVDTTPKMLTIARQRADAAGVDIAWQQRSFEDLAGLDPAPVVTSSFGAMFAGDPQAVALQLDSVTTPDGVIGVTAWHPDGAFGSSPAAITELLGPRPVDATAWSDPDQVASFFAATGRAISHHRVDVVQIHFADVGQAIAELRQWSGPWLMMFRRLSEIGGVEQAERAMAERLTEHSSPTADGIALNARYTVTHLTR